MYLYFMRHGHAEDYSPEGDSGRALTSRGINEAQAVGTALSKLSIQFDMIYSSSRLRALQSSQYVAAATGFTKIIEKLDELTNGAELEQLLKIANAQNSAGHILFVGHQPLLSHWVGKLINSETEAYIKMKPAAIACIELVQLVPREIGSLQWLYQSKHIQSILSS